MLYGRRRAPYLRRGMSDAPESQAAPQREPILNAPTPVVALVAAIIAAFAVQSFLASGEDWGLRAGVSAEALREGRWWTLLSAMFVHGGWSHALMNAAGALAFGTPVARLLAGREGGALPFYLFYLACGVTANLGYAVLNWNNAIPAVGASGAVFGLMGAASRLLFAPPGVVWPVFSRVPLGMAAGLAVAGFLIWFTGVTPGMPGAVVAWEAHLAGFLAGLVLIGPLARTRTRTA